MKSGFITLIGRPNAGKSTLMNRVLNEKVAIVSDKPQTTRNRITGIYNEPDYQMIFIDTPGVHKPKHRLGRFMNEQALGSVREGDLIFYLTDASQPFGGGEQFILDHALQSKGTPIFLLLNKCDLLEPEQIFKTIEAWKERGDFAEIFPISAATGQGVDRLMEIAKTYMQEGPAYYPVDQVTDQPERTIAEELIREKIFERTREEIPHSTAVHIEYLERREEDDKLVIHAVIYIERDSQKGILIGKGGKMLKEIGSAARRDIEMLFDESVYLKLWVKVKKDWRDREAYLRELGYRRDDYVN